MSDWRRRPLERRRQSGRSGPETLSPQRDRSPRWCVWLDPQVHVRLVRRTAAFAVVARAARGDGVQPDISAAAGTRQDVVDGGGVASAVGAPVPITGQHAAPRPGWSVGIPPLRHHVASPAGPPSASATGRVADPVRLRAPRPLHETTCVRRGVTRPGVAGRGRRSVRVRRPPGLPSCASFVFRSTNPPCHQAGEPLGPPANKKPPAGDGRADGAMQLRAASYLIHLGCV